MGMKSEAIDYFAYDNKFLGFKTYFSIKARKKMFENFMQYVKPTDKSVILDLGATPDTKLADSNIFDKLYPYRKQITVCSIEDCSNIVSDLGLKGFVFNEAKKPLPFEDNRFDALFCSAVLEHVGNRADQEFFLNECLRVSRKVFLTTPYRYFPLEMHTFIPFLHWLPWNWFQKIVRVTKGEFWANTDNLNVLCKKDIDKMRLIRQVKIEFVRTAGWKSNMIIKG
ncbi:methyltransferase domain-containing protein [Butyrivibrio sp. AC2005]|uniref:methyltransferase domain-containing protein n=1 Tax=Butyrivibrio sp. AC2005 TaxID=1280672 RepID=UPI0003F97DA2|nr:methyltransferase domain-containing protein [Butyrivibrio sp. AC2005]